MTFGVCNDVVNLKNVDRVFFRNAGRTVTVNTMKLMPLVSLASI